jgi:hypothetical protein
MQHLNYNHPNYLSVHYGINPYWVYNSKVKLLLTGIFFLLFSTVTFSQGESNAKKTDSVNTLLIQNLIAISIMGNA